MGFTSANNTNVGNGKYEINNLIFPSRHVFTTIKSIDKNVRFLCSPDPSNSLWPRINYSPARDDKEGFDAILDRVEERINRFNEKVKIIEEDDAALNQQFLGIIDFLYEAYDLPENNEKHFEKRFFNLANRLWDLGIHPGEF